MNALGHRLIANDRWMMLVDASLANRPLDPPLPRLLQRDPERLLDRLTLFAHRYRAPRTWCPPWLVCFVPLASRHSHCSKLDCSKPAVNASARPFVCSPPPTPTASCAVSPARWQVGNGIFRILPSVNSHARRILLRRKAPLLFFRHPPGCSPARRADDDRPDWHRPGSHRGSPADGNCRR